MKENNFYKLIFPKNITVWLASLLILFTAAQGVAQYDDCNKRTPLVNPSTGPQPVSVTYSSTLVGTWNVGLLPPVNTAGKAIDNNKDDPAVGSMIGAGSVTLTAKYPSGEFTAGSYAGFHIRVTAAGLATGMTIRTLLNGAEKETLNASDFLTITAAAYDIGFIAQQNFNEIEITYSITAGGGTLYVYYPIVHKFCNDPLPPLLTEDEHCNTPTPLTGPNFSVITEVGTTLLANVVDPHAAIENNGYAILDVTAGSAELAVKDVMNQYQYPNGAFVGFDIEHQDLVNLSLLSDLTITLYLGDNPTPVDQSNSGNLLSLGLLSSGRQKIGIVTDKEFDKIKISSSAIINLSGGLKVHNAIIHPYCEGVDLTEDIYCNIATPLVAPNFPLTTEVSSLLLAGVSEANNAVESSGYATLDVTAGEAELAVKNLLESWEFPDGAFVGFDIEQADLLNVGLLSGLQISVWLDNELKDASTEAGLLSAGLLSSGRQKIGFVTKEPFNKIKISNAATLSLSGGIMVHNAFIQPLCEGNALTCNNPTAITAPDYPVYVNSKNTVANGLIDIGVGTSFTGLDNVLNANTDDPAEFVQVAGVLDPVSFSVKKGGLPFSGGEYVGFEFENPTLLSVGVVETVTITTYLDGAPVEVYDGGGLLVSVSLLQGGDRRTIGVVTTEGDPFDEVKITFTNPAVDVSMGTTRIYRFVAGGFCPVSLSCNTEYTLTRDALPAVIEGTRTGFSSLLCVGCQIENVENVISDNPDDFAEIEVPVSVDLFNSPSISVRTPMTEYLAGTMAGFKIRSHRALVEVDLFPSLTISTYLKGQHVESRTGTNLIDLTALLPLLGSETGVFNVGFITSAPFDEIRIQVGALLSVDVFNEIDVYHAFVSTTTGITEDGTFACLITNPDMNVANVGEETSGDVSTNDYNGSAQSVSYGTAAAVSGNPESTTPSVNSDGTYTFLANTAGVYQFDVPVCVGAQTGADCVTERLVITVLDPTRNNNPPVVNNDVIAVEGSDTAPGSTNVDVKANDGPGNIDGTLSDPSVSPTPTPLGDANASGPQISYTPPVGYFGPDTLAYSVTESPSALSGSALVIVRVLPAGTVYISANDDYNRTPMGTTLTIGPANGVLTNDHASHGGDLAVTVDAAARIAATNDAGSVTFQQDGSYSYTPPTGFVGTGVFPYEVCSDGICTGATLYITVFDESALPVKLASFDITAEGSVANLSWTTTEEVNSSHFDIERSTEGKNWVKIGSVTASANSSTLSRYTFADQAPIAGINYYRLRMVDKDGTSAHSDIRSIKFERIAGVRLYPNPVIDQLQIRSDAPIKEVTLYSMTGKTLLKSAKKTDFDLSHLPAGIYTISITHTNGQVTSQKILKK